MDTPKPYSYSNETMPIHDRCMYVQGPHYVDQGLNNEEKRKGFFHVKLQPRLCILMKKPKHCMPAQTVDHAGGPCFSFSFS